MGYSQYWSRSCVMEAIHAMRAAGNRRSLFGLCLDNRFGHASAILGSIICVRRPATICRWYFMSHPWLDTLLLGGAVRETKVGLFE